MGKGRILTVASANFQTSDNASIAYQDDGSGPPIILVPGWSQSANLFDDVSSLLSQRSRVISYDHRGHGRSENVKFGYKVHRLAKDLRELIDHLEIADVTLLGHSMGCSVIWAYLELYGSGGVDRLVVVDEPSVLLRGRSWDDAEAADRGGIFTDDQLFILIEQLRVDNDGAVTKALLTSMFTTSAPSELIERAFEQNMLLNRRHAAELITNHAVFDWGDVITSITVPTLVVGCAASLMPTSAMQWLASKIEDSIYYEFSADEGGSHFPFIENPTRFAQLVAEFMQGHSSGL